mgnify:FL=1
MQEYVLSSWQSHYEIHLGTTGGMQVGADFCSSIWSFALATSPDPKRLYVNLDDIDRWERIDSCMLYASG